MLQITSKANDLILQLCVCVALSALNRIYSNVWIKKSKPTRNCVMTHIINWWQHRLIRLIGLISNRLPINFFI